MKRSHWPRLGRWSTACLALAAACFLVAAAPSAAAEPEFVIKFSWVDPYDPNNPGGHFTSAYAATLQYWVNLLTTGRIRVDLYPAAQLGDHNSALQQIAKGTLEMANANMGNLATVYYPKLAAINMPFLFTSHEHARRALDYTMNPLVKEMIDECVAESGIRIISLLPASPRYMTNNKRPIAAPDDMKGLKMRTMEVVPHMVMMESFGAIPVPISFPELYTSLQTNVVDGQENQLMNIEAQKFYQVQKYVSMTGHTIDIASNVVSEKFYRSLPEDLRAALIEAERIAQLVFISTGALYDSIGVSRLGKQGMQFNFLTPAQIQAFRDRCVPEVRKYLDRELGAEFVRKFMDSVEKARLSIIKEAAN